MVTLQYIIADDDELYKEVIQQQLALIPDLSCIAACSSAIEAGQKLRELSPDLLILDVEMPGLTGIQLMKTLTTQPMVIFISSHPTYAVDAFEVDAVDYLVKPVSTERLMRAVEKARALAELKKNIAPGEGFKNGTENAFFIKEKNAFVKNNHEEVLYIQSLGDFVKSGRGTGEMISVLVSMKNM